MSLRCGVPKGHCAVFMPNVACSNGFLNIRLNPTISSQPVEKLPPTPSDKPVTMTTWRDDTVMCHTGMSITRLSHLDLKQNKNTLTGLSKVCVRMEGIKHCCCTERCVTHTSQMHSVRIMRPTSGCRVKHAIRRRSSCTNGCTNLEKYQTGVTTI